jgi:hypothetical protein
MIGLAEATVSDYTSIGTVIEYFTILSKSDVIPDLDIVTTSTEKFVNYFCNQQGHPFRKRSAQGS